jgi:anti-sigma regulatory factor (Ser/Thr protein kinase)
MKELSLHILDIAENSLKAGSKNISIKISEKKAADTFTITVADDGPGMTQEEVEKVKDPFYSTRTTRRIGLGIPLLTAAAERCDGRVAIQSSPGEGTVVTADFRLSHIDRAPLGDMASTLQILITCNPHVDFAYEHAVDDRGFTLDTREIRNRLGGVDLDNPMVAGWLAEYIKESEEALYSLG